MAFLAVALVAVDVELLEVVLRVRGFVVGGGADDLESAFYRCFRPIFGSKFASE